jgi:hypothetical protein
MQYLPEHKSPEKDNPEGDNYQPTDQEKKDLRTVEKLFDQNKRFKGKYDEKWNDYYNMYRGKQWKEQRPNYRHSEVVNLIFREIQSGVPIQMDSRPKFEFLPMEPGDIELAEIMNQVCEADWNRYNWLEQLTEMVYDSNILGTGLGGMGYDPQEEDGRGAICFSSEDPFYHFPSPLAKDVNKCNQAHIKAEPMSIDEIKKKWPNGKYVKADLIGIKRMDVNGQEKVRFKSPTDAAVAADGSQQYDVNQQPEALVITCYLDGGFEIEEKEVPEHADDGTVQLKYVQQKAHPQGRKIVIANKVVLESTPNPHEHGKFPYARVQNYVNQRQFWGISDIEQLESPQKVFNKLVSFSLDVLTLMGNPVWKVGTSSGVDTENLFNQPGLIIEADDINQVQREEGVQLQPFVLQLIDRMKVWFDDVSGSSDSSRGVRPEGVTAASAIQSLQEATQTRIRQKARNLDSCLQSLGQLYQSYVFQYYTAPRIFRLTNKDGSRRFFKFSVETTVDPQSGEKQKVARYRPFEQGEDGKMYEQPEKLMPVNGMLDLKVNTGSSLSFAKEQNQNKAIQLFDRKIIDDEEVLKAFDYPNWEAVLQRVTEKKAQMAEQQAMQGQPAPQA